MSEKHESKTSPWHYALAACEPNEFSRASYITPEDITAAIDAGAEPAELAREVLEAISRKTVEDWSCCAFVALKAFEKGPT